MTHPAPPDLTGYTLLPWPPRSKGGSGALMPVRGRIVKSGEHRQWVRAVQLWMRSLRWPLRTEPFRLDWELVVPNLRARDAHDNCIGAVTDAGNGILWKDDSLAWRGEWGKSLDRTLQHPQLWFRVREIE